MPLLLLLALPFLEIYFLFEAGATFGFVNLIFFLILKMMIGRAFVQKAAHLSKRKDGNQAKELVSAASIGLGGFLVSLPALITSFVGLLILFPPTRFLLAKIFKNQIANQANFKVFNFGAQFGQSPFGANFQNGPSPFVQPQERDVTPQVIDVRPIQTNKKD